MKVTTKADCGNSPKMALIKDLTIFFASYEIDKVMEFMHEAIVWTLVGDTPIKGKEQFREALEAMKENEVLELTISNVITHGKEAAVHGEMSMKDGSVFGFSDFYEFTSAGCKSAKSITSYVILKKPKSETR